MLTLLAILSPDAHAFRLSAHRALTVRVVQDEGLTEEQAQWLWRGNRAEDTRLDIKWRHFSHYFRPDEALHLPRRGTSDARVAVLWAELQRAERPSRRWTALGGILHHVQDMASPPHVVPVAHDLRDGFESWPVDDLVAGLPRSEVSPLDPMTAHDALAWQTLLMVQEESVAGCGQTIPLSDIWQAPVDGPFGTYGAQDFGEDAGCAELTGAFEAILIDRLAAALVASRAVVRYAQ